MNFFEAQDRARRSTAWLVVLFGLAVIGLIVLTNLFVMTLLAYQQADWAQMNNYAAPPHFQWKIFWIVSAGVSVLVLGGSLYKMLQLAGGGRRVAEALGGKIVPQNSGDLQLRILLNVVEEMAIASGVPVPSVYLLDEPGINAFAAGWTPSDAAIGITRGAVENLNRDELQGVIAHEFSHILNGDMRLNVRLTGVLHGILLLGIIGYYLLRSLRHVRSSRSKNGGGIILVVVVLGIGLIIIGYVGTFFGNWIKASVSRQREYLADSSAVQFTRNPGGIANALKKIGGLLAGSRLQAPGAAEYSHAYFAQGVSPLVESLFSTHPPLEKRIRRIDRRWDGEFIKPTPMALNQEPAQTRNTQPTPAALFGVGMGVGVGQAMHGLQQIGQPSDVHVGYARELLTQIPDAVKTQVRDPQGVRALLYALLMDHQPEVQKRQWALLQAQNDPAVYQKIEMLVPLVSKLDKRLRLPLMDLAVPALRELALPQHRVFKETMHALMLVDNKISLGEWVIQRLLLQHLDEAHGLRKRPRAKYSTLGAVKIECERLMSLCAYAQHSDVAQAQQAFDAGKKAIGAGALNMLARAELTLPLLDTAVDKLEQLKPLIKPRLLKACATSLAVEGQISVDGVELLRAIAASLDCPMPPLLMSA